VVRDPSDRSGAVIDIPFPGRDPARLVFAAPRRTAAELLQQLELIAPQRVVLVIGGAESLDPAIEGRLRQLFELGIVRAAGLAKALIVDGGTQSGIMAALGQAAAESDATVPILGVAPAGRVTWPGDDRPARGTTELEPNHTHFLVANSAAWGGETALLFDAIDVLRGGQPTVAILAGGGDVSAEEARLTARRGIPIVVLQGTGGTADELARRVLAHSDSRRAAGNDTLAGIIAATEVTVMSIDSDPGDLERQIGRLLGTDQTLAEAWRQRDLVAAAARREQREFHTGLSWLLLLGLGLTFLVVSKASLDAVGLATVSPWADNILGFVIIVLPITTTILSTAAGRFRPSNRWILLRGTSESLKHEIFRYRVRAGIYSPEQTRRVPREVKLSEAMGSTMGALMRTDVNALSLSATPWRWPIRANLRFWRKPEPPRLTDPNRLAPLTPDDYITWRITDQVNFYDQKIADLERQGRWLRWLTWIYGGLGTLLAAIGFQIWVAVTTALVGVYATVIEAWQIETSVSLYNQASTDLAAIRAWWYALPPTDQRKQVNIDRLVERAERIMRAENVGWVQEMQDAMTQLRLDQALDRQAGGSGSSGAGTQGGSNEGKRFSGQSNEEETEQT
jgi:hypothetical protein